ncbi:hypothetical protein GGX14DRAFT_578411 [Mycena pura]|uniref:DUF5745 domain-containing protein n=1 Tax=Mycena pura TaxID=153505 RepID=A0AAD6UU28_9AGAR|nr:hypothetical protein GGX14DRAFT_578411 [Mycena pura]
MNQFAADPSRSLDVPSPLLIIQLNQLLSSLEIPINLTTHAELTPSLLVCILETLLRTRLPIPAAHRDALSSSTTAKVHGVKIFLGVLQSDLVGTDVGLSNIDPRRLARGADVETLFIARLLCWYGRRIGLVERPGRSGSEAAARAAVASPSTLTTATATRQSLSVGQPESVTSGGGTSAASAYSSGGDDVDGIPGVIPAPAPQSPPHPRCIHEVPSPPLVLSPLSPPLPLLPVPDPEPDVPSGLLSVATTVRYEGYISLVDEDAEIAAFEAQRRRARKRDRERHAHTDTARGVKDGDVAQRYAAARARRLDLLLQKAEILDEFAHLAIAARDAAAVVPPPLAHLTLGRIHALDMTPTRQAPRSCLIEAHRSQLFRTISLRLSGTQPTIRVHGFALCLPYDVGTIFLAPRHLHLVSSRGASVPTARATAGAASLARYRDPTPQAS